MPEARPLLEDAIDVPLWLDADRAEPLERRISRDRALAARLDRAHARPEALVRAWWAAVRSEPALGARLVAFRRVVVLALVVVGFVAGCGVAAAALRYDGTFPVNVPTVLALLVGVQVALILATLVVLPAGRHGLGALQDAVALFNPGAIAAAIARGLADMPESVAALFRWHRGRGSASRFAKWQLVRWAQSAALAYNAGVLATAFALVTFTDLAFGWTTTLALDSAAIESFTHALATPWAWLVPDAVPSRELIESSRFFRLEHTMIEQRHGAAFTGWWPFIVMSIVTYALIPRVALWIAAGNGVRRATRALLLEDANVTALLDRLQNPVVALHALDGEAEPAWPTKVASAAPASVDAASAVIWSDALPAARAASEAAALGIALADEPLPAGGAGTLDDDARTLDALARARPRRVIVFVRSYEPPLWEFLDFLATLRTKVEPTVSIVVVPVPESGDVASTSDVDTWRRCVATHGDAHLYVEART